MMKRTLAMLFCVAALATPARGQLGTGDESEAFFGLAGQDDARMFEGLRLSPVGLTIGVVGQPIFGRRQVGFTEQVSLFPTIGFETGPFAQHPRTVGNTKPLIVSTTLLRWTSISPEEPGEIGWFVGGGAAVTILTPRAGAKVAPVATVGIRRWRRGKEAGFEAAVQCALTELGRTRCMLPVTSLWPFR